MDAHYWHARLCDGTLYTRRSERLPEGRYLFLVSGIKSLIHIVLFEQLDFGPVTAANVSVEKPRDLSGLEAKLLHDVSNLGNYVLATQAMQSLARSVPGSGRSERTLTLKIVCSGKLKVTYPASRAFQLCVSISSCVSNAIERTLQATGPRFCARHVRSTTRREHHVRHDRW
jgi:hypothetical protein